MSKTKVWLDDKNVYVSFAGGEILVNEKDNAWLYLLGALHDRTPIEVVDNRENLQEHQYKLDCRVN